MDSYYIKQLGATANSAWFGDAVDISSQRRYLSDGKRYHMLLLKKDKKYFDRC